jgi:hypothetical protein
MLSRVPKQRTLASPGADAIPREGRSIARGAAPESGLAFVKAEYEKWKKIIVDANIKEN